MTAGSAFSVTLTAKDAYGNTAAGYHGTVHFSSSDSQATLPANYTFTAADSGSHVFTNGITLQTAGNQTVTATDTVTGSITGSATVSVTTTTGNSYYVSTTGSDSNPGTITQPFRTLGHGVGVLNPGDTLYVPAGVPHQFLMEPGQSFTAMVVKITPKP